MAKQEGWQRGSRGDEIKLEPFRDPTSGKVVKQNQEGQARPLPDPDSKEGFERWSPLRPSK